ncbi:MAG: ROK family protein [Armatimonadetes bacterium]|nr:ROK family protein [Armatimonadota bacterium]
MILGIDLGGTKSAALLLHEDGTVGRRVAAPTPADADAEGLFAFLVDLAQQVRGSEALIGVGVSAGAPADAAHGLVFAAPNLPGWGSTGFPLAARLSEALALPVKIENDADATALAEWRFGAGKGTQNMAFLTVGTGIGSGLIMDGRLHRGRRGAGGEIGHIAVVPNGRPCSCGLHGCLEAYASGPSVTKIAQENGWQGEASGRAVVEAARVGDAACLAALNQAAELLGQALATLAMLLDLERVVLGTLAVHAADLLLPKIRTTLHDHAWPRLTEGLNVVPAALGDRAQDLAALCAWGTS